MARTTASLFELETDAPAAASGPVVCLGHTFPSEEARRVFFLDRLREKLADREFREADGFPIGDGQIILDLSDPPYFTACPNPFFREIIEEAGRRDAPDESYHCEPFAADVTAGKNDTIYMAHSYHTKVPHQAILRYILHYTKPGDVILDGFCGSGMTGVAATLCGTLPAEERAAVERDMPGVKWGRRIAVLNDISPAAAFIAHNYNARVDVPAFRRDAEALIAGAERQSGPLHATNHPGTRPVTGVVNYTVWSEVMSCPECARQIVFFDHGVDTSAEPPAVREEFPCPGCGVRLTKRTIDSFFETVADPLLKQTVQRVKRVPTALKYMVGSKHFSKKLDAADLALIESIKLDDPAVPPPFELAGGSLSAANRVEGMTHLHHYYTARNFLTLSRMVAAATGPRRRQLLNLIQSISVRLCSHLTTYQLGKRGNVPMTGTLYVAALLAEANPVKSLEGKYRDFAKVYESLGQWNYVGCGSSSYLPAVPDASIDYIFIDPPFGDNLNYSQLNLLWEGWLRVRTNVAAEAIMDRASDRDLHFYQEKLRECLAEFYRVLKPGRWMTVAFHNSKNAVWNAIQTAILEAGFVIADVRTLDKKQGTPKQINGLNAVKQDLVISAYKPTENLEKRVTLKPGSEEGVWAFAEDHLGQVPVFVRKGGQAEVVAERQKHLLFDRMIAFHVQRGISVPMSASAFYAGLRERFPERDGMYFLPDQLDEYERRRSGVRQVEQLQLFVTDERSAIQWVRRHLAEKPRSFQALQPLYMKEAQAAWGKNEEPVELLAILEENFVRDAQGRWHVPDPHKESDLEQLRQRVLLKEYQRYQQSRGKLRVVRSEAVRAGFKLAWHEWEYAAIVAMAGRIPEAVIEEDPALLMYLDNARMRLGG